MLPLKLLDSGSGIRFYKGAELNLSLEGWCLILCHCSGPPWLNQWPSWALAANVWCDCHEPSTFFHHSNWLLSVWVKMPLCKPNNFCKLHNIWFQGEDFVPVKSILISSIFFTNNCSKAMALVFFILYVCVGVYVCVCVCGGGGGLVFLFCPVCWLSQMR